MVRTRYGSCHGPARAFNGCRHTAAFDRESGRSDRRTVTPSLSSKSGAVTARRPARAESSDSGPQSCRPAGPEQTQSSGRWHTEPVRRTGVPKSRE
eukprot:251951-Hanusia_phi.AAC.1